MTWVTLATEDALSEAVGDKLVSEHASHLHIAQRLRRNGFGYLRSRLPNFCEMAVHQPVLLITDLDRRPCAGALVSDWMKGREKPTGLLLRVAVREVEAWVLADHVAVRSVLRRPTQSLPHDPDGLDDPKQYLINLAKKGPRAMRDAVVPATGAIAAQGLGYNEFLVAMINQQWSPERAAERSDSLRRARGRLAQLALASQQRR